MTTLSPPQVYVLAREHGFSPAGSLGMVAVVVTESGGRTDAVQPGGQGRGLVQIDLGQHPDVTEAQAFDANWSMAWAFRNSNKGDPNLLTAPLFYGPRDHPETAATAQREALAANPEANRAALLADLGKVILTPGDYQEYKDSGFNITDLPGGGVIKKAASAVETLGGFVAAIGRAVAWLANPRHIWRVVEALLGLALIFVGLAQLGGASGAVANGAQKATGKLLAGA